jgi:carbamate kinase
LAPKIASAIVVAKSGKPAMIGSLEELEAILAGQSGTWVVPDR